MAFALLAGACGGSDVDPSEAVTTTSSDTETGAADEVEATPSGGSVGSPPDPWVLIAPVPPVELPAVESAADAVAQIEAMFSDVTVFLAGDSRTADSGMLDIIENRKVVEFTPDLVLAIFASVTGNAADTYGVIQAHATTGLTAGFDPDSAEYFEVRQRAATALRDANAGVYDLVVRAQTLSFAGRSCVARSLLGDDEPCEEDVAAQPFQDEFFALADFELPDELNDFDDQLARAADLCSLWTNIKTDLGAELVESVDLLIGGSLIDNRFLGRSDCRRDEGLDQYAEWDIAVEGSEFAPVFAAVVEAGAAAEYDEAVYDLDDYQAGLAIQRATMVEVAAAAAPVAQASWRSIAEPNARLGLLFIAYGGELEAWFQTVVLTGGFDADEDPYVGLDGLAPCAPLRFGAADLSACGAEERAIATALNSIDLSRYDHQIVAPHEIIDWEDVSPRLDLCAVWAAALGGADAEATRRIDFQMSQLSLGDLIGVGDCETSADSGDASS